MGATSAIDRIVVGVDGSPASQSVLRWAAAAATRGGAVLEVVHVWSLPIEPYPTGLYLDPGPYQEAAKIVLEGALETVASGDPKPVEVRSTLVEGDAATTLVDHASGARMLVVGSRGRGGFVGLLLGSVSRKCLHQAPCPVAVIRAPWTGDEHGRIVVGVDGSDPSYAALHWAVDEAARRGARLDVVHAYAYPVPVSPIGTLTPMDRSEFEKSSRALLEEMTGGARRDSRLKAVELISAGTSPTQGLLEAAHDADLLVVGSRGLGGIRELFLGSVSQQCAHHATCPVVVVRPPEA